MHSQAFPGFLSIGVAKKTCPMCKMLAQAILSQKSLTVQLPGAHSTFFPWVPPEWLPLDVLDSLEKTLLGHVKEMISGDHLTRSRASSPFSDRVAAVESGEGEHYTGLRQALRKEKAIAMT
ncbi:hypothetical protein FB45DRAFT_969603 [Roridomyces roridus]|uniref:Uncharacterized protein n=1 Tax=Roridomyces roridus TaxID=1738132 RepID=A0AAD7AWM4_9AGAR|nr:hypothetical protein FB45DRAFT_969603 [Roridomyces roridus]